MKELLKDWHNWLPLLGVVVLALIGVIFWLRRKPEDADEIERKRCVFLNRVGRIVEGQILEIVEHSRDPQEVRPSGILEKRKSAGVAAANGTRKLLYYTYSISGVTYETAQDVTGLEERLHVTRIATGQTASVKYDPSNPSNSILLADDWSGLH